MITLIDVSYRAPRRNQVVVFYRRQVYDNMAGPSHYAMQLVLLKSDELHQLEGLDQSHGGEVTPLELGDRVWLTTIDGEFSGTVVEDWQPPSDRNVLAFLDQFGLVSFHRSVFRCWSVLDHLAQTQSSAT